jgi:hypothetical protein
LGNDSLGSETWDVSRVADVFLYLDNIEANYGGKESCTGAIEKSKSLITTILDGDFVFTE